MRPWVGLIDASPHSEAGNRTEPPISEPTVSGPRCAATAAAPPLVEPPVLNDRFHGLRVTPWAVLTPAANMPKSGIVVLAKMMAPASLRLVAGGESKSGNGLFI